MFLEKIIIHSDAWQLRPPLHIHHFLIHVIDFRPLHGQQKGGVGGNDKLAAEKPR